MNTDRRALLRAVAATGAIGSVAGCLGSLGTGGDGTTQSGNDGSTTDADQTTATTQEQSVDREYTDWLFAPEAINMGSDTESHYRWRTWDLERMLTHQDATGDQLVDRYRSNSGSVLKNLGLDVKQVSTTTIYLTLNNKPRFILGLGSFDSETVTQELERLQRETEVLGYEIYLTERGKTGVAVGENTFVIGATEATKQDLERLIRTQDGQHDRYHEVNQDCRELLGALGEGVLVQGHTSPQVQETGDGQFQGQVAGGKAVTIDGTTARFRRITLFADEKSADPAPVSQYYEQNGSAILDRGLENVDTEQSGRQVLLTATTGVEGLVVDPPIKQERQKTTPAASFDFEWDLDENKLTITHAGGDTLNTANTQELRVSSSDGTLDEVWELPIQAGASFETTADLAGETVRVVWTSPDGSRSQVLAQFAVPE